MYYDCGLMIVVGIVLVGVMIGYWLASQVTAKGKKLPTLLVVLGWVILDSLVKGHFKAFNYSNEYVLKSLNFIWLLIVGYFCGRLIEFFYRSYFKNIIRKKKL